MYAGITNKKKNKHKSKKVVSGKCIFPFKYKRTKYKGGTFATREEAFTTTYWNRSEA